jgi:uncharacterized membrane protein YccC
MIARGTQRTPGADPTRLPIGLDLRAISVIEGVRAGLAAALPMAASAFLHAPILALAALGALLTCIVDPGGPLRRRLPVLLAMALGGGVLLGGFGMLRGMGIGVTLAAAVPALFWAGFLRVWGQATLSLGNLLAVVLLLGTDDTLAPGRAAEATALFAAGGAWSLLLALLLWRIYPYGPARRAVASVWLELAGLVRRIGLVAGKPAGAAAADGWDVQARAGRNTVRTAIEQARDTLLATLDSRGLISGPAAQNFVRLEAADQLFGALIALSDVLEHAPPEVLAAAATLLRRLRPLLTVMAGAIEHESLQRQPRIERAIDAMLADAERTPALRHLARAVAERLRSAVKLIDPSQYLPGSGSQGEAGVPWRERLLDPLQSNWSFASASMRHALRMAVVVGAALAATLMWHGPYTHWLTITLVLVMQPFFATTWQRSLERVAGTLLGGAFAAGLSAVVNTRLVLAALLPLLGALALAVRQVSYGVYIAVYTPVVILLVENIHAGEDQVQIALARAGFTILGGVIAIAANALLWPAWEPEQVQRNLLQTIGAHAAYARCVLSGAASDAKRRTAGLASNNLEASLQRAMHEPRRTHRARLAAVLIADAALRRIAGRLAALALLEPQARQENGQSTRAWVCEALAALADGQSPPLRPEETTRIEMLDRLARQVELLSGVLEKARQDAPSVQPPAAPAVQAA